MMVAESDRRSRKPRRTGKSDVVSSSSSSSHANTTTTTKGNGIELGVVLSLVIVLLYFYGTFESASVLPDVVDGRYIGANLNIANMVDGGNNRAAETSSKRNDQADRTDTDTNAVQGGEANQNQNHVTSNSVGGGRVIEIPYSTWPVTFKDEVNNYETIVHPGDKHTKMSVPKFWSPPVHNKQQFSREQAMKIGTCIEPDPTTGSHVRGDECPVEKRTIYIAIASYRDFQCRYTVESAFKRAKYPDRIRVGIVDQIVEGEDPICDEPIESCEEKPDQALCRYASQVDAFKVDAPLSIGPVFARHIGHRMYRGEYYATQSDAHVSFTTDWDVDIIQQLEATHNEMAVLSTYLTDVQGSIDENTGASLRHTRPIMCNTYYEGGNQGLHLRHGSQPERRPSIHGLPQLQPWWAAGYSFSRGHFVVNVPYDQHLPMIFQGEEMSIGIRGYTIGYDFYAPERSVCFHHYAVGKNAAVRNKVKHFWENGKLYAGTGVKAMSRLLGIVHMNPEVDPSTWDHTEEDIYGLGGVRTPESFYQTFGIDVVEKTTVDNLCDFVDKAGTMHNTFTPYLRKDGMGIDYTNIHFHWVKKEKQEKQQKK